MIVALTPCPCLDRALEVEELRPGALHRPKVVYERAGGKGLNLARAVGRLGGEAVAVAPLGGWAGARLRRLARQERLPLLGVSGPPNRLCHILLHPGGPTELYERCPGPGGSVLRRMARVLPKGLRVLSGNLPSGVEPLEALRLLGPFAVDSSSAFAAALQAGVGLVKPNRAELAALRPGDPLEAAQGLFRETGVRILASLGEEGVVYAGPEGLLWARGPRREGNPVGSGDTLLGAFLLGLERGEPIPQALALAVAAGTANVGRGGGDVDPQEVAALIRGVEVRAWPS
ncbi:1-phosphofructokinase family hexose kinase [Thermus tenuipuniceus]|uniref:1-phosphofructokinase family hexose kinase n=1 Tax=Thermus tenuipuniceus TaxID=2078690 RepID=UPI000CF9DD21|nr:PfkB family carbohydrate kinase [Thermus tenuipuniceus]